MNLIELIRTITMPMRVILALIIAIILLPMILVHMMYMIISPEDALHESKELLHDVRRFISHGV